MSELIKLIADRLFYDAKGKRNIPQGVMFYSDSERAVTLVDGKFASIVERPKKPVDDKGDGNTPLVPVKPVEPVKKPAAKKVVIKTPAKAKTVKKVK